MAKTKGVFRGFDNPTPLKANDTQEIKKEENKVIGKNELARSGRHGPDFYESLNNSPFVVGIYSSEFGDFFNKEKLESLISANIDKNKKNNTKSSFIQNDYIHQYITSLNLTSSINAPFLTLEFTAKMPAEIFHYYFQSNLSKSPTTGQWIALYTRNEKSKSIIYKTNSVEILNQFEDTQLGNIAEFTDALNTLNTDNIKAPANQSSNVKREQLKEKKEKAVKALNEKNNKKILESSQKTNKELDEMNAYYQPHHCMFFGIVENLTYRMIATNTGIPMFEVNVKCGSFISHCEKDQYLVALPKIEENINGAVHNKSLSEYAKNSKFKPISAFIKDVDYWKSMIKEFTSAGSSKNQNLGYEIKKILLSLTRNYLPLDMHAISCKQSFTDPVSNEKINENCLLTLGSIINVASEQQHLPSECSYRQMLPLTARHVSTIDRFKTTLSGKGTVWNLINGTFVVDNNLIECFPVMIPFNNRKELIDILQNYASNSFVKSADNEYLNADLKRPGFRPFLYDEAIAAFYEQLGAIPTLIYRLKPLQPNGQISRDNINLVNDIAGLDGFERLENSTYSEKLVLGKDRKIKHIETTTKGQYDHNKEYGKQNIKVNETQIDVDLEKFGFEDLLNFNKDAPISLFLPSLNFDELLSFEAQNNENDRINGLYIESPIIRQKSNLTIGSFADPIIDIKDAVAQGFRFYDSDYPFFDTYIGSKPKEMSAMIERYYAIYGGGQTRSRGNIQVKMNYNPEFIVGSWIRIRMNNDQYIIDKDIVKDRENASEEYGLAQKEVDEKRNIKFGLDDTSDFFCYIENISYIYSSDGPGLNCICNIQFSRGSFGLNYAHFPNVRLENHLDSTKTYNESKIDIYLDKQKSTKPKTIPTKTPNFGNIEETLKKAIKNDPKSRQNGDLKQNVTLPAASVIDFTQKLPTNPKAQNQDKNNFKEGLKDIIEPTSVEEKRFENNNTNLDLKNTPQEIEIPIIKKHNMQPIVKFGPYKAGSTGPFPTWPDVNGDLILGMAEFRIIFPNAIEDLQNIIALNQDALSRGFEQLEEPDVLDWQAQNGIIPIGVVGE